jgi:hypothetical protein
MWSNDAMKLISTICGVAAVVILASPDALGDERQALWPPTFAHSQIATTPGGYHATTRGTIRLVFPHRGEWLVFRGGPDTYHFSDDGKIWTATEAPQASRSHLIRGDTIHTFYSVLVEPAPKWQFDHFVCQGTIGDKTIAWGKPHKLGTRVSYYPDLHLDGAGYFTATGRAVIHNEAGEAAGTEVLWKRSARPGDIAEWGPDTRCIRHVGDIASGRDGWKKVGSTAHENVVLDGGRSLAIAMMTSGGKGQLFGNLFDGQKWGETDIVLASGMSTWAGTDRRMCAVYDKAAKIIHLGYVDGEGKLWYRSGRPPYGEGSWSEPVQLQPFSTFTVVLSLDTSQDPAHVYVLFGKTLYEDKRDLRNTYGALYLQRLDGTGWSEPALVSEPDTRDNWYPNMNEDVRHGIGVLYLKGSGRTRKGKKPPLDIMFACTGSPTRGE